MRLLALLFAFQQALWIDVPFVRQDKDGCGSAVIWMVMKYWQPDAAIELNDIQQRLYSRPAGGIYAKDMARYFESHAYRAFTFRGEWQDLQDHVAKGRPLIVCLEKNNRGVPLHYVVVAGIDPIQDLVLVNDPAQRKLLSIARAEFERTWAATDNWTLLAVPELDLASQAFRADNLPEAREHLSSALRTNPADAYANDFLGTVYFLQNNTEAALKYWNRAGKPAITNIRIDPPLRSDPVLIDRAFAFSRGSKLELSAFEETQARLNALHIFSRYRMELTPAAGEQFDVTLRAAERTGMNRWSWARGLPFASVEPELSNVGGKGSNIQSMLRWDRNKRRAFLQFETPLGGDPKWKLRASVDGRDENWAGAAGGFRMKKIEAGAHIHAVPSGHWSWTSGASVSNRTFSNGSYSSGVEMKYTGSVGRTLLRQPERRLTIDSELIFDAGKLFAPNSLRFAKATTKTSLRWRSLTSAVRLGTAFGQVPFDERFMLGLERDSDLWLRAHSATIDGRKNALNTSPAFAVTNSDFQKTIVNTAWFRIGAGPFVDTGKSSISPGWIFDTGIELRFNVLGSVGIKVSYGKSLSDPHHSVFVRQQSE